MVEAGKGEFLDRDSNETYYQSAVKPGELIVGYSIKDPVKGVSGTGLLVVVKFKGIGVGSSRVAFGAVEISGPGAVTGFETLLEEAEINVLN